MEIYNSLKVKMENEGKKNIELEVNKTLGDGQSKIITDITRLDQIFTNLLSNAVKFTEKGVVEFGYERRGSKTLLFYVKDTGIGIPEDKMEKIFDRFIQADDSITRKYGGTGLGLSISKALVELLDGKIWVESEEGSGSTFYFTIPYEKVILSEKKPEVQPVKSKATWKGRSILVIEDDPSSLQLIREVLEPTGVKLFLCETGEQGIKALLDNPGIDLILLDIKLPDINGLEVIQRIRSLVPNVDIPIIAQSAYAMSGDNQKSLDAGCVDYITKPLDNRILTMKIEKYL
jgi:CheY-like chemotaxis protein